MRFDWEKLGRIFIPQDVKNIFWIHEFSQAPSVLIFDNYIRVYFSSRPPADTKGQYLSYTGFIDLDRNDLFKRINISEKPVFELGELGTFDEHGTYPASFIRREDDIIAYYAGWTRCVSVPFNVAIGVALSNDNGITFQKLGKGPVLSYNPSEPFIIGGPKIRKFNNRWYLWYIGGTKWIKTNNNAEIVNKIRVAISEDGFNWTRDCRNIIENKIEEDECQASPDVFYLNGKYHMFFCYRFSLGFRSKEKGYRIGYAVSDDLINWQRDDEKAGIDVSKSGWDSEMISYPHVFELDNNIYMLYLGNQVGRYGMGLARLTNF